MVLARCIYCFPVTMTSRSLPKCFTRSPNSECMEKSISVRHICPFPLIMVLSPTLLTAEQCSRKSCLEPSIRSLVRALTQILSLISRSAPMLPIIGVFKVNVEFCPKAVFVTYSKRAGLVYFPGYPCCNLNSTVWSHWYKMKPLLAPNTDGIYLLDYSVLSPAGLFVLGQRGQRTGQGLCGGTHFLCYFIARVLSWHSSLKPDTFFQST